MNKITLIMAYYDNPTMLLRQLENIETYDTEIKQNLELVVIDDCSPNSPAWIQLYPGIPVRLYRTLIDVPWNQDFCRNLGAMVAKNEWLLLTDIDHLIPESTMRSIMQERLKKSVVYRFARVSAPLCMPYKLHPNTWLMTREFYWHIGGYDERFAGHYGTDGDFRDRINKYTNIIDLPYSIIRVGRECIPDASTTSLVRKKPEDGIAINRIKIERGNADTLTMSFPYEIIYDTEASDEIEGELA